MLKQVFYTAVLSLLCAGVSLGAVEVIWVSDGASPAVDAANGRLIDPNITDVNRPWDQGWIDLLEAQGYNVSFEAEKFRGDLTEDEVAELEAADLVFVSRLTSSGSYNKADAWNSLTTPVVQMSAYLARSNRWKMLNSSSLSADAPSPVVSVSLELAMEILDVDNPNELTDPNDPNNPNVPLAIYDAQVGRGVVSINTIADAGNGSVWASAPSLDDAIVVAAWDAGTEYYPDAGQVPAGARLVFNAGTREGNAENGFYYGAGMMNLNASGQKLFIKAVRSLLPQLIWVGDGTSPAGDADAGKLIDPNLMDPNSPWDQGWVDLMEAQGYAVSYEPQKYQGDLSDDALAELNAAALVIVSRLTSSGAYNRPDAWNSVTAPVVQLNAYLARSSRWKMLNSKDLQADAPSPLVDTSTAVDVAVFDPNVGRGVVSISSINEVGNGELLTSVALSDALMPGAVVMAQWAAGTEYYEGAEQTPAGPRLLFNAGTREGNADNGFYYGAGMCNLTAEGEILFLEALDSL